MQKFKNILKKVWLSIKKHIWSIVLILLALIVGGFFVWDSYTATIDFDPSFIMPQKKEPELFVAPYSGRMVEKSVLEKRPIAVMIENHPDSRPQSGLNDADIVYETIAEGGITRFLALYHSKESELIGPVRSARSYFVEWADSYDALYAHVGGSKEAISLINKLSISDLNQFYLGKYFWRDSTRWAPHNVYTTTEKLRQAAKSKRYKTETSEINGYLFKDDVEESLRPGSQKFTVNFNANFAPTYTYSIECNCYARSIKGVSQIDKKTKKKVIAKNVVVMFSDLGSSYLRGTAYTTITTTGTGAAYLYQDGVKKIGTWKRVPGKPLRFYDSGGKEFELNSGTTWIDVVAKGTIVK
jgi:hypothetical protein